MTWTRLDDRWTESPEFDKLGGEISWHYLCMIQYCSRAEKYDGRMPTRRALRCSPAEDPDAALAALEQAGLVRVDGGEVIVLRIEEHVPPPSVRESSEKTKLRVQRHRKHKNGDHSTCLPEHCDQAPREPVTRDVTGDVTRYTGTGRDRTGQAGTGRSFASTSGPDPSSRESTAPEEYGQDGLPDWEFAQTAQTGSRYCRVGGCDRPPVPGGDQCVVHQIDTPPHGAARPSMHLTAHHQERTA